MKLLHIDSSALGDYSVSRTLTAGIVARLTNAHSTLDVNYRNLATLELGHWSPLADPDSTDAQLSAALMDEFLAADIVVIGAPMYNFGIPSQLKAWIDRITVAGKTFRYGANGPEGLAGGKRVIIASSRGGVYSVNTPYAALDFQETYLRAVLGFIGIDDLEIIRAEGVATGDENKADAIAAAHDAIAKLPLAVAA
jgi:FMN-dependent NADH-azoreductase